MYQLWLMPPSNACPEKTYVTGSIAAPFIGTNMLINIQRVVRNVVEAISHMGVASIFPNSSSTLNVIFMASSYMISRGEVLSKLIL